MSHWQEALGKTQDVPERLGLSAGLEMPPDKPEETEAKEMPRWIDDGD